MLLLFVHSEYSSCSNCLDLNNLLAKRLKIIGCVFDNHKVKLAETGQNLIPDFSQWKLK